MLFFEDLSEGTVFWGDEIRVERERMLALAAEFDPQGFHLDQGAAKSLGLDDVIASSVVTWGIALRSMYPIVTQLAFLPTRGDFRLTFPAPVMARDLLRLRIEVVAVRQSVKPGRGVVDHKDDLVNGDGKAVLQLEGTWLIATRPVS